ncbi:MAG: glycine cleavage system protein GcvH [Candidatus Eremiobacteraeota bacterium]|nr:glycine cleavage system protein GcvH [Candidatus Eremiobacteraeota bacterium]MCW5867251.1 glycine cleavage system protein GcvH [Candidatus Eremiobacteraeota bacterium]
MIPEELRYTEEHEWVRLNGDVAEIGITHFAQDQLGDIVFVELPAVGFKLQNGKRFGVVESVKTVSELYSPVDGEVVEINSVLSQDSEQFDPEAVNREPYGAGWMIKAKVADPGAVAKLLDAKGYASHTEGH